MPATNANLSVTSDMAVAVARYKRHTQPPGTQTAAQHTDSFHLLQYSFYAQLSLHIHETIQAWWR